MVAELPGGTLGMVCLAQDMSGDGEPTDDKPLAGNSRDKGVGHANHTDDAIEEPCAPVMSCLSGL